MFSEREGEIETENDNVRKRRDLQRTHTRARARALPPATSHSILDVDTKNKSLGAEDALQRRGRSGSRPPDGAA